MSEKHHPVRSHELAASDTDQTFDNTPSRSLPPPPFRPFASTLPNVEAAEFSESEFSTGDGHAFAQSAGSPNPPPSTPRSFTLHVSAQLKKADVLLLAMMKMLNVSQAEAQLVIDREKVHWVNFVPEGQGTDEEGNIIHVLRFRPNYAVRTAHEPLAPDGELSAETREIYTGFREFVEEKEWCQSAAESLPLDPLFESWVDQSGIRPQFQQENVAPFTVGGALLDNSPDLSRYESVKAQVINLVRFDRLRHHRKSIARGIPDEANDLQSHLLSLADQVALQLPPEAGRDLAPGIYDRWLLVRSGLFPIEADLVAGISGDVLDAGLSDQLYALAYEFALLAEQELGKTALVEGENGPLFIQDYAAYRPEEVAQLRELLTLKEARGMEENRRLLLGFYRLHFALFEFMGAKMSGRALEGEADQRKGGQLNQLGKNGRHLLDLLEERPQARKVNAIFYPEAELGAMRLGGEDEAGGQVLDLYLWYDRENAAWVLEDFTKLSDKGKNSHPGKPGAPVPAALFEALDSRFSLPQGALFYRVPSESSYRILRTSGDMPWYAWLRWAAMVGVLAGAAIGTLGASVPATALLVGSSLAFASGEVGEMIDKQAHGKLATADIVLHSAGMMAALLAGTGAATRLALTPAAELALGRVIPAGEHLATQYLAAGEVVADATCFVIFAGNAHAELTELALSDPGNEAGFARALAFFTGMGLLQVVGIRGNLRNSGLMQPGGRIRLDADQRGQVHPVRVDELDEGAELHRQRLQGQQQRITALRADYAQINAKLRNFQEEGWTRAADYGLVLNISGMHYAGLEKDAYRALFRIALVAKKAGKGAQLTVAQLIKRLELLKLKTVYRGKAGKAILRAIVDDVEMKGFSDEERIFVNTYHSRVGNSTMTNIELRSALRAGYEIDANTGMLRQGQQKVRFQHRELSPDQGNGSPVDLELPDDFRPEQSPRMQELVAERESRREVFRAQRDHLAAKREAGLEPTAQEVGAYNKARAAIGRKSEQIAEETMDQLMVHQGFLRIYPGIEMKSSGAGDLDRIYIRQKGDRFQIVEVKGGTSKFGSREVKHVKGVEPGDRAQQGSGVYLLDVVLGMRGSKDETVAEMGDKLGLGISERKVDYLFFRQSFDQDGSLGDRSIGQFDISDMLPYLKDNL